MAEKLTIAQRETLHVLQAMYGKAVRGGKKMSALTPVPHVNTRAADSLVDKGFARRFFLSYASVFSSGYEFQITPEGAQRLREGL
jgi:hypothetical protein